MSSGTRSLAVRSYGFSPEALVPASIEVVPASIEVVPASNGVFESCASTRDALEMIMRSKGVVMNVRRMSIGDRSSRANSSIHDLRELGRMMLRFDHNDLRCR